MAGGAIGSDPRVVVGKVGAVGWEEECCFYPRPRKAEERCDLNSVSKQMLCDSCGCEGPDSMVTWTRVLAVRWRSGLGRELWMTENQQVLCE